MIRLTWLQFRAQAVTAAAALAAFAVLLAATGPHLASMYAASGLSSCQGGGCGQLATTYLQELKADGAEWLYVISVAGILLAPAVIGLFWGAPLIAHELETGTSALVWTQSVTRTRWLAVKLTVGGLAAMAVTEGLSLMQAWWAAPIGRAVGHGAGGSSFITMGQFSSLVFATHGITPLGYAAFAFTLGVTAGALIRRTVPAMAVTLAVFAAVQIAMPLWIRPHLIPASHTVIPVTSLDSTSLTGSTHQVNNSTVQGTFLLGSLDLPGEPGAWVLSSWSVNAAGQVTITTPAACTALSTQSPAFLDCLASHGIREEISYQPASRYWAFQSAETAIYLAPTLALAGYCFRRLNRRLS
jgi:ABC-type transport system involved in multi-copper enzyme maturation permease subunit